MAVVFIIIGFFIFMWVISLVLSDTNNGGSNKSTNSPKTTSYNKTPYIDQVKQREAVARLEQLRQAEWAEQQRQIAAQSQRIQQQVLAEQQRKERERAEQQRQAVARAEQQRQAAERAELDLHERETQYADLIQSAYNRNPYGFSLTVIRSLSRDTGVYDDLKRGEAQLQTEDELLQYTWAFGNMHKAKLHQAFVSLYENSEIGLNDDSIEIIDYGCGQGIGTVGFIDFLKSFPDFTYSIRRVRLIEPSRLALERAALHVRYSLMSVSQEPRINSIHKELDDVTTNNLECDDDTIKFHIFSNILDVEDFDLDDLCRKISNAYKGINYFICVSPNFKPNSIYLHERNSRMVEFMEYFQEQFDVTFISARSSNIGTWTRFERVFMVDFGNVVATKASRNRGFMYDEPDDLPF